MKTENQNDKILKIQTPKTRKKETLNVLHYDQTVWDSLDMVSQTTWEYIASLEEIERMMNTINDITGIVGNDDFHLIMEIRDTARIVDNTVTI